MDQPKVQMLPSLVLVLQQVQVEHLHQGLMLAQLQVAAPRKVVERLKALRSLRSRGGVVVSTLASVLVSTSSAKAVTSSVTAVTVHVRNGNETNESGRTKSRKSVRRKSIGMSSTTSKEVVRDPTVTQEVQVPKLEAAAELQARTTMRVAGALQATIMVRLERPHRRRRLRGRHLRHGRHRAACIWSC